MKNFSSPCRRKNPSILVFCWYLQRSLFRKEKKTSNRALHVLWTRQGCCVLFRINPGSSTSTKQQPCVHLLSTSQNVYIRRVGQYWRKKEELISVIPPRHSHMKEREKEREGERERERKKRKIIRKKMKIKRKSDKIERERERVNSEKENKLCVSKREREREREREISVRERKRVNLNEKKRKRVEIVQERERNIVNLS